MVDRLVRAKRGLGGLCDSSGATFSCRLYVMNTIFKHSQKRALSIHCGPDPGERSSI